MITSDGISQCQANPIIISTKEVPHDFITGILLLDVGAAFGLPFVLESAGKNDVMESKTEGE